jgi:hypothetical protein
VTDSSKACQSHVIVMLHGSSSRFKACVYCVFVQKCIIDNLILTCTESTCTWLPFIWQLAVLKIMDLFMYPLYWMPQGDWPWFLSVYYVPGACDFTLNLEACERYLLGNS